MFLDELIQSFLQAQAARLSANALRAYSYDLGLLARAFPEIHAEQITSQHLSDFILSANLAPSTMARRQAALRAFFRWVHQQNAISEDPTLALEPIKIPERHPSSLTGAQVEAILDAIPADHQRNRLLFTLLAETGLRISEVLQLHIQDIDLYDGNGGYIRHGERIVPLIRAPRSRCLLKPILEQRLAGLLFHGDPRKGGRSDKPLDYTTVLYHFEQYLNTAKANQPNLFSSESQPITIDMMRSALLHQRSEKQQVEAIKIKVGEKSQRPTIGVLIGWRLSWTPNPNSYLNPIFEGITAATGGHGCNLLLACGMNPQTDLSDPTRPAWPTLASDVDFVPVGSWNTDGLIVIDPLISQSRSRDIQEMRAAGHPIVFIGAGEGEPAVFADNEGGILQALEHLIDVHGHQLIAFVAGDLGDLKGDSGARLRAYQAGMKQFGLDVNPDLVAYSYHTVEGGYAAMQQILARRIKFTAVIASNDEAAMGAMQALTEAGLRIPQDVAIIGFDDRREAAAQIPPLTSVHVPLYISGYHAVEMLLRHIDGGVDEHQFLKIATTLAIRQSCGCQPDAGIASMIALQPAGNSTVMRLNSITESIARAVLAETQHFHDLDEVRALCNRLVTSFVQSIDSGSPAEFQHQVDRMLDQAETASEDVHIWQALVSGLRIGMPMLVNGASDMLDQARNAISERMRRQHGRYIIRQKWMSNRIGHLTTRLLMTSSEGQIFDVLADDLPAMGINHASLSFFEAEGSDPVAWSMLHTIPSHPALPMRFPTRHFPPKGLYPTDQPYTLVLVPLVLPTGQVGFIAYDPADVELAGPITQQIAASLNNARLYAEATEGRKLAEEANHLKSHFLSMVSHELKTPLNLINGLSEMLLQQGENAGALPISSINDIGQIHSSAQHLGRLIRDVLDLASSEVGQLRLENSLVDLREALQLVSATGWQMAKAKGLEWQEVLPAPRLWVWGDATRLRQVALNLVVNAVKFTSQGEVRLEVQIDGENVVVMVSDTGLGIPQKDQAYIFDEFRRSEQALARGYGGLGLGLAISKRLVELHGGHIWLHSSGEEGQGSTFYFTLPLVDPTLIHAEDEELPVRDDDLILLLTDPSNSEDRLYSHLLEQGHRVERFQIDEAGDWLTPIIGAQPGVVIFDASIAPSQSWNILSAMKSNPRTQSIPLMFYSLRESQGTMLELDYLTKPVGMAELESALSSQKLRENGDKAFLIVDDDPATLEMHVRFVQTRLGAQHQIMRARNGREAMRLMEQRPPDLVLLDLMMPELDGFGVLEAMREKEATRDIPVIVLTGQMLTETEMNRLNRGVATVLGKGLFSVEETLGHIDAALARKPRLGREAQRLVRRAMAYIHEYYAEPISREDLGRHLGISGDYLTLSFRREVGMTFVAYLNRYRINLAKSELIETNKTVAEIAMSVGFQDNAYFSRVFRRQVGASPDAFRRQHR